MVIGLSPQKHLPSHQFYAISMDFHTFGTSFSIAILNTLYFHYQLRFYAEVIWSSELIFYLFNLNFLIRLVYCKSALPQYLTEIITMV